MVKAPVDVELSSQHRAYHRLRSCQEASSNVHASYREQFVDGCLSGLATTTTPTTSHSKPTEEINAR